MIKEIYLTFKDKSSANSISLSLDPTLPLSPILKKLLQRENSDYATSIDNLNFLLFYKDRIIKDDYLPVELIREEENIIIEYKIIKNIRISGYSKIKGIKILRNTIYLSIANKIYRYTIDTDRLSGIDKDNGIDMDSIIIRDTTDSFITLNEEILEFKGFNSILLSSGKFIRDLRELINNSIDQLEGDSLNHLNLTEPFDDSSLEQLEDGVSSKFIGKYTTIGYVDGRIVSYSDTKDVVRDLFYKKKILSIIEIGEKIFFSTREEVVDLFEGNIIYRCNSIIGIDRIENNLVVVSDNHIDILY